LHSNQSTKLFRESLRRRRRPALHASIRLLHAAASFTRRSASISTCRRARTQRAMPFVWDLDSWPKGRPSELETDGRMTAARSRSRSFQSLAHRMRVQWRAFREISALPLVHPVLLASKRNRNPSLLMRPRESRVTSRSFTSIERENSTS
jgi:hypothetical protein